MQVFCGRFNEIWLKNRVFSKIAWLPGLSAPESGVPALFFGLEGDVNGAYAECESPQGGAGESGMIHNLEHTSPLWHGGNRAWQIGVGTGVA